MKDIASKNKQILKDDSISRMDQHGVGEEREDDGEKCNGHGGNGNVKANAL